MVIVISRDHATFYEAIKARQESSGRDRVFLDRRVNEPRRLVNSGWTPDRRQRDRRASVSPSERALVSVLGFMVLHPELEEPILRKPPVSAAGSLSPGGTRKRRAARRAS
jgi:hypothetical protein